MTKKILDKGMEIAGMVKQRITPAFLVALGLALIFWYSGKLKYTYTAEVPVTVIIEGERHRATCIMEGTGHSIIGARYFKRKMVKLQRTDIEMKPVEGMSDTWEVAPESLQSAISVRYPSLKVLSVSRLPYIILEEY